MFRAMNSWEKIALNNAHFFWLGHYYMVVGEKTYAEVIGFVCFSSTCLHNILKTS